MVVLNLVEHRHGSTVEQTVHIYLPVCDVAGWAQAAVGWIQIADG